jgi:AcrR family transcriptional regulator
MSKKQAIADTAEILFGTRGFDHTSTQQLAKEAGVSEALIFKHFGTKEKLLEALIKNGYRRIVEANRGMLKYDATRPVEFINSLLDLPAKLVAEEPRFWEMQYRLIDMPVSMDGHQRFLGPVKTLLVKAFSRLGYNSPTNEAELLLLLVDALWKREVLQGAGSTKQLSELMKQKYV